MVADLLAGGRSNLTFVVTDGAGNRVVVRRPPLGPLLGKAHDVGREFRLLSALTGSEVPVPTAIAMCSDLDVLGVPFYVMSLVEGTVLKDSATAAQVASATRRSISLYMVEVLAALHRLDPDDIGLGDLARADGYPQRVLTTWMRQLGLSAAGPPGELVRLHEELLRRAPGSYLGGIVHGDYRLENCVVDGQGDGRISGVLDWELCTLGDPLADVGYWLMYWGEPMCDDATTAFPDLPSRLPGFSTRHEILARYEAVTAHDVSTVPYYWALAHWKLACILHGAHERFAAGNMLGAAEETDTIARRSRAMVSLAGAAFDAFCTGDLL